MRKADYHRPDIVEPKTSGCTFFRGEDHGYEARQKAHQKEQQLALLMQMEENKAKKELEKKQNMLYDAQRLAVADAVNKNNEDFQLRNRAVSQ